MPALPFKLSSTDFTVIVKGRGRLSVVLRVDDLFLLVIGPSPCPLQCFPVAERLLVRIFGTGDWQLSE
jgi:hypothetical protein